MMGSTLGFGIPAIGMILFWGFIVVLVVLLARALSGESPRQGRSARRILDERFARGEIDRDEYERRKEALD